MRYQTTSATAELPAEHHLASHLKPRLDDLLQAHQVWLDCLRNLIDQEMSRSGRPERTKRNAVQSFDTASRTCMLARLARQHYDRRLNEFRKLSEDGDTRLDPAARQWCRQVAELLEPGSKWPAGLIGD